MEQTPDASVQASLNELLRDIADTLAAFDGRIAYVTTPEGQCKVSFGGQHEMVEVTLEGRVKASNLVEVHLLDTKVAEQNGVQTLYEGPFTPAAMYQRIGAKLAQWYGDLVRKRT